MAACGLRFPAPRVRPLRYSDACAGSSEPVTERGLLWRCPTHRYAHAWFADSSAVTSADLDGRSGPTLAKFGRTNRGPLLPNLDGRSGPTLAKSGTSPELGPLSLPVRAPASLARPRARHGAIAPRRGRPRTRHR